MVPVLNKGLSDRTVNSTYSNTESYEIPNSTSIANSFTARCYASAVYAVDVCPSDGWQ